ncbi:hypothetical protein ABPG72_010707 [Tetrahymena utriculariae]
MYFFILSIILRYISSQQLEVCSKQNTYYDLAYQSCGSCQEFCNLCDDFSTCLQCYPNYYYDQRTNKCVKECQKGDFQQDYFEICILCSVENCEICQFEGQLCQQCKQGWQLSSDQKYCLKNECLANQYSFYNLITDSCTTNCPSSSNKSNRTCSSLKQYSQIKSLASRNKVNQEDIQYVYFFDSILGNQMVVTLNSINAILYSYPGLIPMNQMVFLNSYSQVAKDSQNLFLISTQNVQKIDLLQQSISIIYKMTSLYFTFSKTQLFLFSTNQVTTYNFSTGHEQTYQIKNLTSVDFQPYSFNVPGSNSGTSSTPSAPQSPQQNSAQPKIQTILDSQGCMQIQNSIEQNPTKQKLDIFERDFLLESQISQQKIVNLFQNVNSPESFESLGDSFAFYLDSNNRINFYYLNLNLQIQSYNYLKNIQVLYVYQYSGKTRLIVIQPNYFNGIYQSAVVCANLTQNVTSQQYYFEYDMPHYAQSTSQIIEFIITNDKNFLVLATSQGYEIINISPQMSMTITNSSQNWSYIFSSINNSLFSHSKFLSTNLLLFYNITSNSIQLQLLSFSDQGFQNSENQISINSTGYSNFNINFNQIYNIDNKTLIICYKNQLIMMTFPNKNSNQTIYFSSFVENNSAYYMQGIFKVLYSEDVNILAIIFKNGFRIIRLNGQKLILEKNLMLQIVQAEVVSQYLILVYQYNTQSYNFVVVNLLSSQMSQYQIQSGSIYISLIKQQNPQKIFLGIYYSNQITLFCISSKKIDVFLINASPQLTQVNQDLIIQTLNDNIYISTIEYFIIVFSYDSVNSQLNQIDNFFTVDNFNLIDNKNTIVITKCQNTSQFALFNRVLKQNYLLKLMTSPYGINIMIQTFHSSQYNQLIVIIPFYYRGAKTMNVVNLTSYSSQTINFRNVSYANDVNFFINYQSISLVYNFSNLQNTSLNLPSFASLSSYNNFIQLLNTTNILIQNINNQLYLFNIQNQLATQIFLNTQEQNQLTLVQQSQIVFYQSKNIVSNYFFSQNIFLLPETYDSSYNMYFQSQYEHNLMVICPEHTYFIDISTNQYLKQDIPNGQKIETLMTYRLLKNKLLFGTNPNNQLEIVDSYFNQVYAFNNQTQVLYIQELDAFFLVNQNNQVSFMKNQFFQIMDINLFLPDSVSLLGYYGVIQSRNTILIYISQQKQQISFLYLYNYYTQQISQLLDVNQAFNWKTLLIVQNDQVVIFTRYNSFLIFEVQSNNTYQIIIQQNFTDQFNQQFDSNQIYIDTNNNLMIQFKISNSIFRVFDYQQVLLCEQLFTNTAKSFHYLLNQVFILISQKAINVVNYKNCLVQSASFQGLQFLVQAGRFNPIYSIIDNDLDTIIITSQNRLNIFQYSTLKFLGILDYYDYFSDNCVYYNKLSNALAIQYADKLQFQLFDLWTPLFTSLYQNSLKSYRNRFIYNPGTSTIIHINYNSNLLNVFNSNDYSIVQQFKFKESISATQYFTQLYQISNSTILAITSNSEFVVYDFIINQQVKYLSSSFNCLLYSNYTSDIYCLEYNNVLKKFNYTELDFSMLTDQTVIKLQVTEFVALSKTTIAFISSLGKMILLNPITLQVSPIISTQLFIDKMAQIEQYIIVQSQQQYLQVYQLQSQLNTLNVASSFQFNKTGQKVQDFAVINFNNSKTLVLATSLSINIYNMQTNELIGILPTSCQNSLQFKQDDIYLYVLCSFQITVYDKRVLKLINYQKINQFIYSNLKDVQHLYHDFFALMLYNDLLIIKLNSQQSNIIDSFDNLDNPFIYQVNSIYLSKNESILSQIKLKCYSDSNLFDIDFYVQDNNYLVNEVLLNFVQSSSIFSNKIQQQELQRRVVSQKSNLIKYIVQMNIEYSSLSQIQIFYNIFSQQTTIEYQFIIQQNSIQRKGIANLTDSSFVLPQFYILSFQTIILQINLNQNKFLLNQYGTLRTLKFNNVDFIFDVNSSSNFLISNLDTLILESINIQDQQIDGNYSSIIIVNVTNVLISNMIIDKIKIINQPLFSFQNVTNITIFDLSLFSSQVAETIFYFFDCKIVQINQINVQKLTIQQGNLFKIIKSSLVQISNAKATQISQTSQTTRILKSVQRVLQSSQQSLITTLFNLQGCYNTTIQNLEFDYFIEIGVLQSNHYALTDQLQYFSKQIFIQNITLQEFKFSIQRNQLISITSLQVQLNQLNITSINSFNSLISLNIQNELLLSDSFFSNINLQQGSIIGMVQGQLKLTNSTFINSFSSGLPCAINIQQSDLINIKISNFINLNNNLKQIIQGNEIKHYQGGAIAILNSKQIFIQNSLFFNCSSLKQGGAIYSSQQMEGNFTIEMSNFIENKSIQNSGGAIYLSQLGGINITKSNFTKNKALFENGGAIAFDSSNLLQFSDNIFSFNEASIGGSIYYLNINSNLMDKNLLVQNKIIFQFNKASFYGKNIGSVPKHIGITNHPHLETLKIVEGYSVHNIASGNYLEKKIYLNFIDEENNPFNFLGSDLYYDRSQFYFQLNTQNNSQIIIQEGMNSILNKTIGMFELNFQSLFKISQNQSIQIISNQFEQGKILSIPLNLHFRNCVIGEIVLESNQFITCSQCAQGRYSLKIPDMDKDINQIQCISCPEMANFCQGSKIQLKDGYWRESNQTDQIYTCLLDSCSFGNPQNIKGCLTGYVGPLCNSCDSKQQFWGEQYGFRDKNCYPCSQQLKQIAFVCVFIFFYVFYIAMSQQNITASKIRIIKLQIFKQIGLLITSNLSSSGNEVSLWYKIFINYLQILSCSTFFGIFNQKFFTIPVNLLGDAINITVTSFDCLFKMSDKYPIWLNRIITQLFAILIISLLTLILLMTKLLRSYKKREDAFKQFPIIIRMALVFLYIFYQPSISKILIQSLICTRIGDKYYLTSDYSQRCYDHYHLLYSLTIIVPLTIIFCFLIPYFLFLKLKYLQKVDSQNNPISKKVRSIMTYGFLYTGYKEKLLYWEILKIFHKFILMILINIVLEDNIKLMLIICQIFMYYQQLLKSQPYSNHNYYYEEKNLMQKLVYTFLILLAVINDFTESKIFSQISFVVIVLINIGSIQILFVILFGQIHFQKNMSKPIGVLVEMIFLKIKQKFPNSLRLFRQRQVKLVRIHSLWKKVISEFRKKSFKLKSNDNTYPVEKKINQEEKNLIQNFESQEIKSPIISSNILLNQTNLQKKLKCSNFQKQISKEQTKLEQLENSELIQEKLSQNKRQTSDQQAQDFQLSPSNNLKLNFITEKPYQQEISDESGFVIDQENNSVQMGQNNIFDNIIASNKFQQFKQTKEKKNE